MTLRTPTLIGTIPTVALAPALLTIVRHAESTRNSAKAGQFFFANEAARGDLENDPDHRTCLTETGRAQARELGNTLLGAFGAFDVVYHSGYQRTRETAEGVLEAWPADAVSRRDVRSHLFLRERDGGYTFNMTTAEAKAAFPWLQAHWELSGRFFARPPGAESIADVALRVHLFLEEIKTTCAGQRVMVVTHGGPLRMFRYWLEGWSHEDVVDRWDREAVPNCCVIAYAAGEDGRLKPLALPQSAEHLGPNRT